MFLILVSLSALLIVKAEKDPQVPTPGSALRMLDAQSLQQFCNPGDGVQAGGVLEGEEVFDGAWLKPHMDVLEEGG